MKELVIFPNPENNSYDKGLFFENLISRVFKNQRFKVKERINFTGMEIDLLCEHIDRGEKAFIECKAREELSSSDIKGLIFNTQFKNADYGYFLYTKYFQHQAGGTIEEVKNDSRYKNIYFWDCEKIIELLIDSGEVKECPKYILNYRVSKEILLYSYYGIFYILLLSNSTLSEYYLVFDARTMDIIQEKSIIEKIKKNIRDIEALQLFDQYFVTNKSSTQLQADENIEVVAEIQESESWDDYYKPASSEFFVGRKVIIDEVITFFKKVMNKETNNRIFYIDGKSGWGKSSIVNKLKGKCLSKYYTKKFFLLAVDSRSATTSNFVSLSFKKIIEEALRIGFLEYDISSLEIASNYEILSSKTTKELLAFLEKKKKLLIIVFDQFEDVFRKGDLFKAFYKFLMDVRNTSSNIVVGFSWKSEINIPIGHEAYYLWQQSKEYSQKFGIVEFDFTESKGIISQLEKAINLKLDKDFIRKIIDNSQGFPWLVKKLCVHIYKQIHNNVPVNTLFEQDFNVETLFNEDLEGLTPDENRALRYIADRAFEDNPFDITETDEIISANIIESLVLHKKLVIRSGSKYNVYWDIFRDYLVTEEVPKIGESYLIRQAVPSVLEIFLLFRDNKNLTLYKLLKLKATKEGTILNSLRLLRDLGLIKQKDDGYILRYDDMVVNEDSFKNYIHNKLLKHIIYLEMQKREGQIIELPDLTEIIRHKFKGRNFSEYTLEVYAKDFLNWITFAEIEISNISNKIKNDPNGSITYKPNNLKTFVPQNDFEEIIKLFKSLKNEQKYIYSSKLYKSLYDLKSLGLITYFKNTIYITTLGKSMINIPEQDFIKNICSEALKLEKINRSYNIIKANPEISQTEFKNMVDDILLRVKNSIYRSNTNRNLYNWGRFIYKNI